MSLVHFIELILVMAILVAVGIPLFSKLPDKKLFPDPDDLMEEYKHLQVRKEEILLAIKELEFDFKTDKLSEKDYQDTRKKLETEAVALMERMDAVEILKKKKPGTS